ncbi:MAG: hypothetical protein JXA57_14845, partial [Armatimonadetes bacterium]|nr:hypothetical protein [Armatimonadota bacterium]
QRSMKAQMKEANRVGARFTAVIGEEEARADTVTLRDMQTGEQETVSRGELARQVEKALSADNRTGTPADESQP